MMKGPNLLKENANRLRTRMGACFPGDRANFRGHDLHTDLKDIDWVELYVLGITGRRYSGNQLRMLHALWTHTSYPDARIWNNRVSALAGSSRSTGALGMAAALAVSDACIYGRGIDIRAITFFIRTKKALDNGGTLADCVQEELKNYRGIAGYGRPIASGDERLAPMMSLARALHMDNGPYVRLAYEIEQLLLAGRWRWRLNYGALAAALGADLGFSAKEYYLFAFPAFLAGMQPCFIEATERPEGTLFPLSCAHVLYEGRPKRPFIGSSQSKT